MTNKEMIAVMQAFYDGKEIECSSRGENDWLWTANPMWDWSNNDYRIKPEPPEPKYVPYDSVTEVDKDKWIKNKGNGILSRIMGIDANEALCVRLIGGWRTLKDLFEYYTYEDGTPCGKKVEE